LTTASKSALHDEIGELGAKFNQMASVLKASRVAGEKIEQRSREIMEIEAAARAQIAIPGYV
jgi:hypothetical protein